MRGRVLTFHAVHVVNPYEDCNRIIFMLAQREVIHLSSPNDYRDDAHHRFSSIGIKLNAVTCTRCRPGITTEAAPVYRIVARADHDQHVSDTAAADRRGSS